MRGSGNGHPAARYTRSDRAGTGSPIPPESLKSSRLPDWRSDGERGARTFAEQTVSVRAVGVAVSLSCDDSSDPSTSDPRNQQPGKYIGDECNDEQQQASFHHRGNEQAGCRLTKLVGNNTGQRVPRVQEAGADWRGLVADHRSHGDRFTQSAP